LAATAVAEGRDPSRLVDDGINARPIDGLVSALGTRALGKAEERRDDQGGSERARASIIAVAALRLVFRDTPPGIEVILTSVARDSRILGDTWGLRRPSPSKGGRSPHHRRGARRFRHDLARHTDLAAR
jgi:hypothetical protein